MIQQLKVGMAAVFSLPHIINGVDHKLESQIDHKNTKSGTAFFVTVAPPKLGLICKRITPHEV